MLKEDKKELTMEEMDQVVGGASLSHYCSHCGLILTRCTCIGRTARESLSGSSPSPRPLSGTAGRL